MSVIDNGDKLMEKLVSLCKRRGFIFPSSEIYGGYNGFWDYGPYGCRMKRAIEALWWREMVETRDNIEGLDSTIICHPRVWKASGHIDQFSDLMCDCKDCKARHRVDQMPDPTVCPACGSKNLTEPREFNLMMKTHVGPVSDDEHIAYMRAETCQPIFVDYDLVRIAARQKLPFGVAQIGKAFRNEINPRNFTFRSREFTQMEMEFFCDGEESMQWFEYWKEQRIKYYKEKLQFDDSFFRIYEHEKLAHYAKAAIDIEVQFPFGWGELEGVHHRGTWDLSQHSQFSGADLQYIDHDRGRKIMPTVIETSVGLDRTFLALLGKAYDEDTAATQKEGMAEDVRVVLHLPPLVAPVQVAVLPLSKKLNEQAEKLYNDINRYFRSEFDTTGSIGKRYRRQDEIGTPLCLTFDFDSAADNAVTVRDRDTMAQERVSIDQLRTYIENVIGI